MALHQCWTNTKKKDFFPLKRAFLGEIERFVRLSNQTSSFRMETRHQQIG